MTKTYNTRKELDEAIDRGELKRENFIHWVDEADSLKPKQQLPGQLEWYYILPVTVAENGKSLDEQEI